MKSENGREAVPVPAGPDPRVASRSRWRSLPPDILRQASRRVGIVALAIGTIWAIVLLMNTVIAPLLGHVHTPEMKMIWPMPGNLICALGIAASLVTYSLTRRLRSNPHVVLDVGIAFQVVNAALVAFLAHWHPVMGTTRISWLCLIILLQPAIVPSPPLKTLIVSLLIATMDPLSVWVSHLRGMLAPTDIYTLVWYFLPNYIAVGLALIPATMISGLGRKVNQARELGSYQLGELIGKGGMGEVYHANHRMLARPAAIKLIRPESIGGENRAEAEVVIRRFHREAQAAAMLRSPHTISLYDFGVTDEGTFYYVMEYLEGFDLDTLVRRFGPVPPERAIYMIQHASRSLGEAHTRGLIHRDVKPSNIFTCRLGLNVDFVKVLDFGLVKEDRRGAARGTTVLLTNPDVATGTPAFMAPEMALGEPTVDSRADIYALGCVGYWLLTGRLVFEAESPVKMMLKHIQSEPAPPSRVSEVPIPPELDRVILDCLAKNPEDRPQGMSAVFCSLNAVPLREPWTAARAEEWWQSHGPTSVPFTQLRPETPLATVHAAK